MKYIFLLFTCFLIISNSTAQEVLNYKPEEKVFNYLDLQGSYGKDGFLNTKTIGKEQWAASFAWHYLYGLDKKRIFRLGFGLRVSTYGGKGQEMVYSLGPLEKADKEFDPLYLENSRLNIVNAMLSAQVSLKRFDFGGNIDVGGFSFGGSQEGVYPHGFGLGSNPTIPNKAYLFPSSAPSTYNLLLAGKNDKGSLNSELFFRC